MIVPAFTAALLLAGAPANSGDVPPAAPVAAPAASDQAVRVPAAPVAAVEPPTPAQPPLPGQPAAPASNPALDQNDIVVQARRRSAPGDPAQAVNAKTFAVTQGVDKAFVGPVALAYKHVLPAPVRNGLRNFLNNLHEPVIFINFLLQLRPGKAAETLGRFAVNSTIGGAGLFDVAKRRPFNLPRRRNGLADTLGFYGVKPGPFLFLPLIGPTTLRDLVGGVVDGLVLPSAFGKPFNRLSYTLPTGILRGLDRRAEFDEQLNKVRDGATDAYVTTRKLYLERRQAEIDELRGRRRAAPSPAPGIADPPVDPFTP